MKVITPENVDDIKFTRFTKLPNELEAKQMDCDFLVETTKGEFLKGFKGDYMVRGLAGCLYPVNKKIFEDNHIKVLK